MLTDNQNLKDPNSKPVVWQEEAVSFIKGDEQNRLNKLITALYMVTDIMDKEEPLRNKLRILGADIVSDNHNKSQNLTQRISEILSFLDIATTLNLVSEMNSNILKKEFIDLKKRMAENLEAKPLWLEEFFKDKNENVSSGLPYLPKEKLSSRKPKEQKAKSIGHLGVQKGSTLMKALKDNLSDKNNLTKNTRREQILKIIKEKNGEVAIKDLLLSFETLGEKIGDKTLQRELVAMISSGLLNKTGEKRWSRYFLPK